MTTDNQVRYWRITFFPDGKINNVREVKRPQHNRWIVVEAPDEQAARKRGYNMYCARKKQEAKVRKHANGQCVCGRKQDRPHPDGGFYKTCSVCKERQDKVYRPQYEQRVKDGTIGQIPRDESARVESCKERVRDRKAEIRLEVLLEVRTAWENSNTMGHFTKWLKTQLDQLLLPSQSGLGGKKQ